jgi:O-acetyl-ADP-ribose deacetylase (regulator of RNase III)
MNIQCKSCGVLDVVVEGIVYPWHRQRLPWWLNPSLFNGQAAQILHSAGQACFQELPSSLALTAAVHTSAGELSYRYRGIVHVAGSSLLGSCTASQVCKSTENALRVAQEAGLSSIAFPVVDHEFGSLSQEEALGLVLRTLRGASAAGRFDVERVVLCTMGFSIAETTENLNPFASLAC